MQDHNKKREGSKQQIIDNFEKDVDKLEQMKRQMPQKATFNYKDESKKVPNLSKRPSLAGLKELQIKDLELDKTHRGAFIRGTLCTRPKAITAANSLIEDRDGNITAISFYNLMDTVTF